MKKILVSMFLLVFGLCLVGCTDEPIKTYEDEYFIYNKKEYMNDDKIFLSGLTEKGKEQEILYIPSSFNGNKVILSNIAIISNLLQITSDSLKKVYMDAGLTSFGNFRVVNNDIKIMIVSTTIKSYPDQGTVYISSKTFSELERKPIRPEVMPANISYNYNYENSPNDGYYWLDDYDNELITYIPTNPIRSGYQFGGWYKEAECINKWDFENDMVPEKEYDISEDYIFYETILYAKWIKE